MNILDDLDRMIAREDPEAYRRIKRMDRRLDIALIVALAVCGLGIALTVYLHLRGLL